MRTDSGTPALSVLVAAHNARSTISACLRSLEAQRTSAPFEIIVADSSSDGTDNLVAQGFPGVRLIHSDERMYCGEARNLALSQAHGEIIAFIDADCTVPPDWAELVLAAHRGPQAAIGGAIANGNPESLVGWAAYLCEFSQWLPGTPVGPMADIAGASMTYKKAILSQCGPFIQGTYGSDTEFHWRLACQGLRPLFEPSIVVFHHSIRELRAFLRHELQHGRCFARVRVRHKGLPDAHRLTYALCWPLIAFRLLAAVCWRCRRSPRHAAHLLACLPLLALGLIAWSCGEAWGYLEETS